MRRGKGKTLEGEGPPFRRRVQRGKAAIGRFCFAKSPLLPPNLPQPPRTSPMSPPFRKWKFVSLFRMAGTWGKFFVALGGETFCRVRLSHPIGKWNVIRYDALCAISEHQRRKAILQVVANATASPQGEAFFTPCIHSKYNLNTADRYVANNTSYFRSVALLCSAKEALQKGFPSGGSCRVSD